MQDVQQLCERVVVVDHGTKVFDGTLAELTNRYADTRHLRLAFSNGVPEDLNTFGEIVQRGENYVVLEIASADTASATAQILHRYEVVDIAVEQIPVEEVIRDLFTHDLPDRSA
jgi:ABC-2 type transport system ATP-binding protein